MANKEELKEKTAEEYAGLGTRVFVCRKEDFERQPGQPYINEEGNLVTFVGQGENKMEWEHMEKLMGEMWHEVPLVNSSITASGPSFCVDGQDISHHDHFGFTGTLTLVDEEEAHYEAQMLAVTVLPVFSKSMMPVTLPHTPFQLRDGYTKLYRNPHNFFYSAMVSIYSSSFFRKKSEEDEEQLFEKLEAVQQFFNYDLSQSTLFHRWLKSK